MGPKFPPLGRCCTKTDGEGSIALFFSNSGVCFIRNNGQDMYISESNFGEPSFKLKGIWHI